MLCERGEREGGRETKREGERGREREREGCNEPFLKVVAACGSSRHSSKVEILTAFQINRRCRHADLLSVPRGSVQSICIVE
jgi:hypothetical protein